MSEETRRVLEMLSAGKVTVLEAEQLLQAVTSAAASAPDGKKPEPRYVRIQVTQPDRDGKKAETVNIRVPLTVVRGGIRLGAFIPGMLGQSKIRLRDGGEIDLLKMDPAAFEAMLKDLGEVSVNVDDEEGKQVRIRCE
jgi:hypothetical protein